MFKTKVQVTGLEAVQKQLGALSKQLPYAASKALNQVGRKVISTEAEVMRRVLDRPTPYTLDSLRLEPATKANLVATVTTKDGASGDRNATRWLGPEAYGGARREKGFERSLRAAGILPVGMYVVPGPGAKLDVYGNWSIRQMNQVLVSMRLAGTAAAARRIGKLKAKDAVRKRAMPQRYFVLPRQDGDLEPGIYERKGTRWGEGVRPVAVFCKSLPKYRRRFPFNEVAARVFRNEFPDALDRSLAEAMATAK